ncbi:MAG: hypothetical protein V1787_02230 [Candidatus Micrarchaeota archaeon]
MRMDRAQQTGMVFAAIAFTALLTAGCTQPAAGPTPVPTQTPSPTLTATPTPTATATPVPTPVPTTYPGGVIEEAVEKALS